MTAELNGAKSRAGKKFVFFIALLALGALTGYLVLRQSAQLTPEAFRNLVLSLGLIGPLIYVGLFVIRPFFILPSIALFIAGGLAFGQFLGPLYATAGVTLGGSIAFWVARKMGREFVLARLGKRAGFMKNQRFNFPAIFLSSLIPAVPITLINYGAGLSLVDFGTYVIAHMLGIAPRAFAYGFFGNALTESFATALPKLIAAMAAIVLLGLAGLFIRHKSKPPQDELAQ